MASRKYKQWSVVTASTTAFTVCFMVWMMFAVIGIPIKQTLGLNETQFGILVATAGADRLADPPAAGHVDRPVRRAHRVLHPDAVHRVPDLADFPGHRVLALPGDRPVRGRGRRLVHGRHRLLRALVPAEPPGARHGHLRRRQYRRGGHQARRADHRGGVRLGDGAAGVCRAHAGDGGAVLVLHASPTRSMPRARPRSR